MIKENEHIQVDTDIHTDLGTAMLTTIDNPFNPFTDFHSWWKYDIQHHHNCCGLLARIAHQSEALTDTENDELIEIAINEILRADPEHIYRKIYPNSPI